MYNAAVFFDKGRNVSNIPTVFTIDTTLVGGTSSNDSTFTIRLQNFKGNIDWGDSFTETNVTVDSKTRVYAAPGIYTITLTKNNTPINFNFRFNADSRKITTFLSYGNKMSIVSSSFATAINLNFENTNGIPIIGSSLQTTFLETNISKINNLELRELSNVTTIRGTFQSNKYYNQSLTINSNVLISAYQFLDGAIGYNSDLMINTPNLVDMQFMMRNTHAFNKDISNWVFNKNADLEYFMAGRTAASYNATYLDSFIFNLRNIVVGTGRTQTKKIADFGSIKRTSASDIPYNELVADGWTIRGGTK